VKQINTRPLADAVKAVLADLAITGVKRCAAPPRLERATIGGLLPLGAVVAGMAWMPTDTNAQSAQQPQSEITLPGVDVKSARDAPDGARATTTRVGKTLQDPHDIPQAVTTVTNSLMQEQQVGSLREALRNVSGLTFNAA
jgi:catecholate siderophore receptor